MFVALLIGTNYLYEDMISYHSLCVDMENNKRRKIEENEPNHGKKHTLYPLK
jgi:hypothetical protein